MEGIKDTIVNGLKNARLNPDDVDFVSAHATATKMGDVAEAMAIAKVYGMGPSVTGLKSYMGHTMGSCGVIESILTLYMMEKGFMAPTLNLEKVDPRCNMIRHTQTLRETPVKTASIQNFAFGGVNTSLFLRKI